MNATTVNNDDSILQRTGNDESSKLAAPEKDRRTDEEPSSLLVETISSLSPNVSSLNVTRNQSELADITPK